MTEDEERRIRESAQREVREAEANGTLEPVTPELRAYVAVRIRGER